MATNEPIQDQNHEVREEAYPEQSIVEDEDEDEEPEEEEDEDQHQHHHNDQQQQQKQQPQSMPIVDTVTAESPSGGDKIDRKELSDRDDIDPNDGDEIEERKKVKHSLDGEEGEQEQKGAKEEEDLEEGELKDDDDDDDDDDDEVDGVDHNINNDAGGDNEPTRRVPGYNNNNDNNNNNNNGGFSKEPSFNNDNRHHDHTNHPQQYHHQHHQNYSSHHQSASGGQLPTHLFPYAHAVRRMSPNSMLQSEMHGQYPSNHAPLHHPFNNNNSNNNHYRYPPNDGPPHPMNHQGVGMYPRGGPGSVGPMNKVNIRCRFYSKTSNKCTWGDHCRFEHRDDSPGPGQGPEFDTRPPPGQGPMHQQEPSGHPGSSRGPPAQGPLSGTPERGQYPPQYAGRHQPYPPPPPHGYHPYEAYGHHHHSTPPPMPPHSMPHGWRQQHSPYPSPSSAHPPESVSPALLPTPSAGSTGPAGSQNSVPGGRGAPGSSGGSGSSGGGGAPPMGGAQSPGGGGSGNAGYPSPSSSSAVVYERKHRLAYELAPWNDRGYPPASKYDRGDAAVYPSSGGRGFYRNHYSREPPYGRESLSHMSGPYPGYPNYPSAYRGGPMGPHASHYKFMGSSQRSMPADSRRSRSNKRGHDEDESSWSDSGSEDSILGQANYGSSSKSHTAKASKQQHHHQQQQQQQSSENQASDEPLDQGSGTPPGEPMPEDRERQEMLLNKLKEIEDLMAKKKGEQEDPM